MCKNHYQQPQRNGFHRPLPIQQILSWVAFLIEIIVYFTLIFPALDKGWRIGITIPYCIIFITYNTCFILAALCKHESAYIAPDSKEMGFNCKWCGKIVNMKSKHCRCCNICRMDFDHHCFFLNNCVTKDNYILFLSGVYSLMISSILSTLLSIYVIMGNEYYDNEIIDKLSDFYGGKFPKALEYVLLGLFLVMLLGCQVFCTYLIALHALLHRKRISTWDLIVYRRQMTLQKLSSNIHKVRN